ncbi:uncharacterized protein LOC129758600 [Uranotaenia lowii]|uniref:uncharacterized protein LOC129758600 n=1 Tax=Uranotaenia lowii TaxID=190385 RepID=UPI00247AB9C5|nr:uncharacterized protein LOC129758600 [Uranotaenia lowii]
MKNRIVILVVVFSILAVDVISANTALQPVVKNSTEHSEARQAVVTTANRWWPYGWGWGWGWGIAVFVLAIVKGSILLGLFVIWAFFRGFGGKHGGCAPIIIRESPPPSYSHPPWDRSGYVSGPQLTRSKRSTDYRDSELYWTDMITDLGFSFLGIHSKDCRKRFVCEVDVQARTDPMIQLATHMFGRDIFRLYRSAGDQLAKSVDQCGQIYSQCKLLAPSLTFGAFTGQIDPMADYDDTMAASIDDAEETTDTATPVETDQKELSKQTMSEPLREKKYFNKRKRYFKITNVK